MQQFFMKKIQLCILACLLTVCFHLGMAKQSLNVVSFSKLTTSQARIAYINQFFAQSSLAQYDSLLPIIQTKKDTETELFWHHRKHISLDIFSLTAAERKRNLQEMRLKARNARNQAAEIVADFHIDFLKHEYTRDSSVTLYYRNLKRFDKMKAIGLSQFIVYDLNLLLWKMGKDLAQYWQADKGLDFLVVAEKYTQKDTVGLYYHTEVLSAIRNCYYFNWDYEPANAYSQKIINLHQALNPTANPKQWWSLYWQMRATFEMATLYIATYGLKKENYKQGKGHLKDRFCQVDTTQALKLGHTYMEKGVRLYKQPFDLQTATRSQLMMEYDVLEELAGLQLSRERLSAAKSLIVRMDTIQKRLDFEHTEDFTKRWELYRLYEIFYLGIKDYKNTYKYKNLMGDIENNVYYRNAQNQLEEMKQVHQIDKYSVQIKTVEREKKQNLYIAIGAILLTLLISLVAYWVYYRIKKDNDIISSQKEQLENSLLEKEMLLKEVHHRVKNNLQIIAGLFEKQMEKTQDESTLKNLRDGQDRLFSIALVHQNLYQSDNLSSLQIKDYIEMLVSNIQKAQANPNQAITVSVNSDNSTLDIDTAIPLGLILNELITNCYKYAFKGREKGNILIEFLKEETKFQLSIKDDGVGIGKEVNLQKISSLGLHLVRGLTRQLDAILKMESDENGTCFLIKSRG